MLVVVVVGVIVFVVLVVVNVVVAFSVANWGSATVTAAAVGLSFCRHRERAAVLAGV